MTNAKKNGLPFREHVVESEWGYPNISIREWRKAFEEFDRKRGIIRDDNRLEFSKKIKK